MLIPDVKRKSINGFKYEDARGFSVCTFVDIFRLFWGLFSSSNAKEQMKTPWWSMHQLYLTMSERYGALDHFSTLDINSVHILIVFTLS